MAETTQRQDSMYDEIISDETFETMLDALDGTGDDKNVAELLQVMNENRIITREEAEQILEVEGPNKVVKCGLPPHVRPSDPENTTDPEECISRLMKDDPSLVEINLNNMKRTPIPVIQRMLMALKTNTHLKKLMLANTALTDAGAEPILETLESNTTLEMLNIETNFLSGDFLARLFKAALINQTIREIKAVNQSPTFSTEAEMEIMHAVHSNRGLTKVSVNLRHPEAKNKIEQACLRNGEIKRQQRRLEQLNKQKEMEEIRSGVTHNNNVEEVKEVKPKATAKVDEKKPTEKAPPAKKDLTKKPAEKPAVTPAVKKETKPVEKKEPEKEKAPVKKPAEPEKKVVEKEKPAVKKEIGKKPEEKSAVPAAPAPPPAPKVEAPKEAPPAPAPEKAAAPKPTLAMAAKEAAAKAAARGFGTSAAPDVTPKKKLSIGERKKSIEEIVKPIVDTSTTLPSKIVSRPGTLNLASKDVPTSKGLGAATFGATAPKPPTPSKATEPPKGRRGSGTMKPPPLATPTPKTETAGRKWSATKPPGSGIGAKEKTDSMTSSITEKPKSISYGYGGGKKRDSIK